MLSDVMTVKEASMLSGLSVSQVLKRIRKGHIDASKMGWIWVIPRTELDKLQQ